MSTTYNLDRILVADSEPDVPTLRQALHAREVADDRTKAVTHMPK
jgi:hypothetical protein